MVDELGLSPTGNTTTMSRLEALRKTTNRGIDYWHARDVGPVLGYPTWREFRYVIGRAIAACAGNDVDHARHFVRTPKVMKHGGGTETQGEDFFLSRLACYLVAMNGQPSKPEVAAAQAYFAVQTRRMEVEDQTQDLKRLELREKATVAFKRVSGVAKGAGVRNRAQPIFHDARYQGLYGAAGADVKRAKCLTKVDNLFDFAGPLELSANEFQMNLAADVIAREGIRGEQVTIARNKTVGQEVRKVMENSGASMPERLPLEAEPIAKVKKRLEGPKHKIPGTNQITSRRKSANKEAKR